MIEVNMMTDDRDGMKIKLSAYTPSNMKTRVNMTTEMNSIMFQ
jgi:hypothetical protein